MINYPVFPSLFFETKIEDKNILRSLAEEIQSKKNTMSAVSSMYSGQGIDEYITDYADPSKLEVFENFIFPQIGKELNEIFLDTSIEVMLSHYWTAIYRGGQGYHSKHIHKSTMFAKNNYSGILYLTDHGNTTFFSGNPSSFDNDFSVAPEVGKVILFPSTLVHSATDNASEHERIVVSFNLLISTK